LGVIPACFWRESRKKAWMPAFAGMTGGDWTLFYVALYLVPKASPTMFSEIAEGHQGKQ
jgi:hypothetical protein